MFVLGCDRAHLYAHPDRELTGEEVARFDNALKERTRGVPSQYITGHQEFWGMGTHRHPSSPHSASRD